MYFKDSKYFSGCRFLSNEAIASIIQGYANMISDLVEDGWNAYYVSILFHQLPGTERSHLEQMKREVNRLYCSLTMRTVKDTRSKCWARYLPVAIFAPDLPVPKGRGKPKASLAEVTTNGGLHINGIILANRWGKIRTGLKKHFAEKKCVYEKDAVRAIGIERITKEDLHTVVDYTFKQFERRRFSTDDIMVLDWGGPDKAEKSEETARKQLGVSRPEWLKRTKRS